MTELRRFLYVFWQWTWGLPQNVVGGILYLHYRRKGCPCFSYQGARAVIWTQKSGSMSMGMFLFLHPTWKPHNHRLLSHEYGHTIQSLLLGPMYLPLVGIPSILWAGLPAFERMRRRTHRSYYSVYPENWANRCGDRFAKTRAEIDETKPRL